MFDIHSHLVYGVDDGSKSLDESISILKNLHSVGVSDIVLTPHYVNYSTYISDASNNKNRLEEIKKRLKEENINMNVYLGNEIYIDRDIEELLRNKKISSLNDTKYLLIELPMSGEHESYEDIFLDLIDSGFNVILAHPERYLTFQKNFDLISELNEIGVLFQCNVESILDKYSKKARKTFIKMLKSGYVSFMGTDIHHEKDKYDFISKAKDKIKKYLTEEEIENIFSKNASKMIKNEDL